MTREEYERLKHLTRDGANSAELMEAVKLLIEVVWRLSLRAPS